MVPVGGVGVCGHPGGAGGVCGQPGVWPAGGCGQTGGERTDRRRSCGPSRGGVCRGRPHRCGLGCADEAAADSAEDASRLARGRRGGRRWHEAAGW